MANITALMVTMNKSKNHIDENNLLSAPLLNASGLAQDIGRTLIVAPHPDDEALGCGGLIALLNSQDAEVHIVFVTNGGASHPNSNAYSTFKLQELRKLEAISSCLSLGVRKDNIHFMELKDSKLHELKEYDKSEFSKRLNSIFKSCHFDSIVVTWRRDAHSDHRETYKLCQTFIKQLKRPIQIIEYPIWLWKNGKISDWPKYNEVEPFRLNIENALETKLNAIQQHKSQTTRMISDDPEGFILTPELLKPFLGNYEYYLFTLDSTKPTLDKEYFRYLYTKSHDPWNFRTSNYERKKYLKTLKYLKYYRFENVLEIGCSIGEHSNLLARHCNHLVSIDISLEAINNAKNKYGNRDIEFKVWNITEGLPKGNFDLVTMCEVGYYLEKKDLIALYSRINKQLNLKGFLLLVHWTSYVRDYPLTGRQVHQIFENLNIAENKYSKIDTFIHPSYELVLWQKAKL